jgi:predicted O-methyltransferase YrrM
MSEQNLISRAATALWTRRNPDLPQSHPDRELPHLELNLRTTARFAVDMAALAIARRRHTVEQPWITREAIKILSGMLRRADIGLEFGSGGSTVWLARHVGHLYSVEAFEHWHTPLLDKLAAAKIDNVTLELVSADQLGYESPAHKHAYTNARHELTPESLDFVLIDGEYRDDTALRAVGLLKPGGLLILDNANSYLPNLSRTPWRVHQPASQNWARFLTEVQGWRHIWTTNGAWDTALWIKS